MRALHVLLLAEAHGVWIHLDDAGTLRMEAAAEPPAELVEMLREHRGALLALLNHDASEASALADHYATLAGPELPEPDPLAEGLLRGFAAHRGGRR
ncbi:hypothetical protein J8J14_09510 [Roseomonas sp. SSH11]|uniref:TubC N-terminal docking domain-containing protein n=1 Tax=Pararoseomonas baculiformis TaxID=2820812 RepID=A0ABS4ADS6_9PROT|nr:hypothetical protein [Pararoseomonas baculiformis]MBP0445016.1 hypothetical protein [Pararoseomonas baculiformis]